MIRSCNIISINLTWSNKDTSSGSWIKITPRPWPDFSCSKLFWKAFGLSYVFAIDLMLLWFFIFSGFWIFGFQIETDGKSPLSIF